MMPTTRLPLGDTSLMGGVKVPLCSCGEPMVPRVFFGRIYGWRCPSCEPIVSNGWSNAGGKGTTQQQPASVTKEQSHD